MCLKRLVFIALLALQSSAGEGAGSGTIAIGAAATPAPALTVQYLANPDHAYHFTTHYNPEGARLSGDYQRLLVPAFGYGRGWRLAFYTGFGLAGESQRQDELSEIYQLRLPLGGQCEFTDLHLNTFAEVAAALGPLPETRIALGMAAGLRATF